MRRSRLIRATVGGAILLTAFAIVETALDFGQSTEFCPDCAAYSRVRHFTVIGFGGRGARVVTTGPLARFIQRHSRFPCTHRWQRVSGSGGGLVVRQTGCGNGLSLARAQEVELFPSLNGLLGDGLMRDPQFIQHLQTAIDDASYEAYCEVLPEWEPCTTVNR